MILYQCPLFWINLTLFNDLLKHYENCHSHLTSTHIARLVYPVLYYHYIYYHLQLLHYSYFIIIRLPFDFHCILLDYWCTKSSTILESILLLGDIAV